MKSLLTYFTIIAACSCAAKSEPPTLEFTTRYADALEADFNDSAAFFSVAYLSAFWRVAGNAGFDSAVDHVRSGLQNGGFTPVSGLEEPDSPFYFRIDTSKLDQRLTWEPIGATLTITDHKGSPVVENDYARTPVFLVQNSHAGSFRLDVVDVGSGGNAEDYDDQDVKGKVVFGDAPAPLLFLQAVKRFGAAGVISGFVPAYNRPESNRDLVAQEEIPLSETLRSFALKTSRRQTTKLREALAQGACLAAIRIQTEFKPAKLRTVIAEIRGTTVPAEHIVCVSHIDHYKPGANDNASGVAAQLEMALALKRLIDKGALERPKRTITMLWVDEYKSEFEPGGTGYWQTAYPIEFVKTKAAFALDMVGEDVAKTGGSFRIEKYPDPSAIWTRPPDEHSGWGEGLVDESRLKGSFINDYTWQVFSRYAKTRDWPVTRNPFEGGSDHQLFVDALIPAVLLWHFPDQFYHTSGDDPDKVSAAEMRRVAAATGASVLGLASLEPVNAESIAELVRLEGENRLRRELENSRKAGGDLSRERRILEAWTTWYTQAILSVADVAIRPDQRVLTGLSEKAESFKATAARIMEQL